VRLDALGDVLMTTPAIRALRESRPGRRITLLTSPPGAGIAALVPEIDEVIVYDAPWVKMTAPRADSRPDWALVEQLRAAHFDAAVIFTVYSQNPLPATLLCYLAGIPLRLAHCRENPYQLLTDWVPDPEPEGGVRHEVQRQLDLVAAVGCRTADPHLSLRVPPPAYERVSALLQEGGIDQCRPWIAIHAGSTAASRRYPPEHFAAAARRLVLDHGVAVVFTGTQAEVELVAGIRRAMAAPSLSLVNRLNLAELAALFSLAPAVISNNSGPAHIAAAVGTPLVDLYALTNPQHTPWMVPSRVLYHNVPCKWCYRSICPEGHHACLRQVEPETVVAALLDLLGTAEATREQLRYAETALSL
jgi:lipopolysaccharide heptosyltransferase II